jgi:hypothetical protein
VDAQKAADETSAVLKVRACCIAPTHCRAGRYKNGLCDGMFVEDQPLRVEGGGGRLHQWLRAGDTVPTVVCFKLTLLSCDCGCCTMQSEMITIGADKAHDKSGLAHVMQSFDIGGGGGDGGGCGGDDDEDLLDLLDDAS